METEGSLLCLQELATGPYSEPDKSSLHPNILCLEYPWFFHLRLGLPSGHFPFRISG
jgi:hypothetical protein